MVPNPPTSNELEHVATGLSEGPSSSQIIKCNKVLARLGYIHIGTRSRLNDHQWRALTEGFAKGAGKSEKERLAEILEAAGFVPKERQRDKPGRAKRATTNSTSKELQQLRSELRSSLAVGEAPTHLEVYQLAYVLLSIIDNILKTYLLISDDDCSQIVVLREKARNSQRDFITDIIPTFDAFIATFGSAEAEVFPQLSVFISEAECHLRNALRETSNPKRLFQLPETEQEAFEDFTRILALDDVGGIRAAEKEMATRAADLREKAAVPEGFFWDPDNWQIPEFVPLSAATLEKIKISADEQDRIFQLDFDQFNAKPVLERSDLTRADVLRTLLARLRHLDQLFVDIDQGIHVDDLGSVGRILHDEMLQFAVAPDCKDVLDGIKSVLLGACQRQGPNPLSIMTSESLISFGPVSERGSSTGGYLDGKRSIREQSQRRPFKKIKTRLPESTPGNDGNATKAKSSGKKRRPEKAENKKRCHARAASKGTKQNRSTAI